MTRSLSTRATRLWAAGLTGALVSGAAAAAAPSSATDLVNASQAVEDGASRFTVAVLPDTQFYSRYSAAQFFPRYGTDPFEVQTQWIVEHDDELNTAFTLHLGDVVDQEWVEGEWAAADRAISALEDGGADFSILPGNHDVANPGSRGTEQNAANYLTHFPQSRISDGSTWVSSHQNGYSSAHVFEAEGQEFLVLAIGWNAPASTWEWAQTVLDAHPTLPTILTSHAIVDVDKATGEAVDTAFGQELWEQLIRANDQIFVTLNGHFHGQTRRVLTNDAGHAVHQLLLDSQMAADGGNGIMGLMEFDLEAGTLDFATISPWVSVKDPETRTPSDTPVLSGDAADFTLDIDFQTRFAAFAPDFGPGDGSHGDLSERAKAIVSEGWDGGDGGGALEAPGARTDYVHVEGTLAHWRFGSVAEGVLPEGGAVPDETGDNPMHRLPLDQTNAPGEVDDVTITHTNVPSLSADMGAICFDEASRQTGVTNSITTDYEVPVTQASLDHGYTVESFVYLADDWSVADNQWGGWLTRAGRRSTLPISWERYDYEMGPAFFSVSNLREFQWATSQGTPWTGTTSLWSGEIMTGTWYHVAAVNDPSTSTTIMYVDGVPVLRNATNHDGMTFNEGYPWVIGTVFSHDEPSNGWNGCVGETRIVDRALNPSEFLIARADIDSVFSPAELPTGTLPAGSSVETVSGTGHPGSEVRLESAVSAGGGGIASAAGDGVLASTTVAADGTWTLTLAQELREPGPHALALVPSIGSRDGQAIPVSFSIAAAADGGGDSGGGDADGGGDAGGGNGAGDGGAESPAGDGGDPAGSGGGQDGLASTGLDVRVWLVAAIGALLGLAGAALVMRRRRTVQE